MPLFEKLQLWLDPVRRPGPEAMAVDEWLLETAVCPVLRVYGWEGDWASIGYFGKSAEAAQSFPGVGLVRRWTGGGIVDHRADWTYTLVVPHGEKLANLKGAASYQMIHEILMESLDHEKIVSVISNGSQTTDSNFCFKNPVEHDLVSLDGGKLAGAGQRRSKSGLLHQGSVALETRDESVSRQRGINLATLLAREWEDFPSAPDSADLAARISARYARDEWLNRR